MPRVSDVNTVGFTAPVTLERFEHMRITSIQCNSLLPGRSASLVNARRRFRGKDLMLEFRTDPNISSSRHRVDRLDYFVTRTIIVAGVDS